MNHLSHRGFESVFLAARREVPLALLAVALPVLFACGGGEPAEPVARVQVKPTELRLPYPGSATLETVWHPVAPVGEEEPPELIVFVHLLDGDGGILRTFDHPYPRSGPGSWKPDEAVRDEVEIWQSALAPALEAGRYTLTLGLVEAGSGRRWPLAFEGREPEAVDRGEYAVATVVVPDEDREQALEVSFTGPWNPVAAEPDRQVLATRMLVGEGAVVFRDPSPDGAAPLAVEMVLHVPREEESGYRLVSPSGGGEAVITVRSDCAPGPTRLVGRGSHRLQLRLQPPEGGGECAVHIAPDFVLVHPTTFQRVAVQLRRLTWSRGGAGDAATASSPSPAS